ncbi:uncharacterized protein BCR38DRAFT_52565 [Pseudomassariella vexata]|uniref:Uncharacterized protein n=1 Tax=Pseudomassariella vexata TaxID=1141098 RepID=A0A1Y2DLM2_9PEZI|nr:uncharacterized protein BCR38DRAFT_52565 [Pseudomassariella vexata]ORY60036.1 hypothetical protein BCR38DRAFT_52565 [Pseudomassariella vexata]
MSATEMEDPRDSVDTTSAKLEPSPPNGVEAHEADEIPPAKDESRPPSVTNRTEPTPVAVPEDDDTADEVGLSPPPSSSVSSVNPDVLGDEIIVGTGPRAGPTNGGKPSLLRVVPDHEDEVMADVEEDDEPLTSHYPKRKRASIYNDLGEDKLEGSLLNGAEDIGTPVPSAYSTSRRQGIPGPGVKSVILGYWRDSPAPVESGKHAVIGFMDVRDRLRTRIQNVTRKGDAINSRLFPIPPGPGGSWVTFERIVFDDHLVLLDHNEIKEYVKLRQNCEEATPEEKHKAELAAVEVAKARLAVKPPPETNQPVPIAYGLSIPENATNRPDKRRRIGSVASNISTGQQPQPSMAMAQPQHHHQMQPQPQPLPQMQPQPPFPSPSSSQSRMPPPMPHILENLPGARPTRILVGCWSRSPPARDEDKHAVTGILGANDMFRVKLMKETMDGRPVDAEFPTGAGALWIPYEEVKFLNHVKDLTRPEMKEYCRVRQAQIDGGETEEQRVSNETKAVYEAQRRAAANPKAAGPAGAVGSRNSLNGPTPVDYNMRDSPKPEPIPMPAHELRHSRRDMMHNDGRGGRHSMPEADMRPASRTQSLDPLERTNNLARREVAKMESAQLRQERHNAHRIAMSNASSAAAANNAMLQESVVRMNEVWQKQEAQRMQGIQSMQQQQQQMQTMGAGNSDDIKMHEGMRYERKQTGPFAGKLVSQGVIISIDGEDYVEYRVLTKPTFF